MATVGIDIWKGTSPDLLTTFSNTALDISAVADPVQKDVAPLAWQSHESCAWAIQGCHFWETFDFPRVTLTEKHDLIPKTQS